MKKKLLMIIGVLMVLGIFGIAISEIDNRINKKNTEETTTTEVATPEEDCYSFSEVEEIISYLAKNEDEKKELKRLVDPLTKSDYITVSYIKSVASIIGASEDVYTSVIGKSEDEDYISKESFDTIYANIVESGVVDDLISKDIMVYDMQSYTDESGVVRMMLFDGVESYNLIVDLPEEYMDKIINVYIKDGDIFSVNGQSEATITLENVWINHLDSMQCSVLYNGIQKNYSISQVYIDSMEVVSISSGEVADITLDNQGIVGVNTYEDVLECRVMDIGDGVLEIENVGSKPISSDFKIYDVHEDVAFCESSLPVLKGHSKVKLFLENGIVTAAVIEDELYTDDIRVILSNDNFTSYTMPSVIINCDTTYKIDYPDESEAVRTSDKTLTIQSQDYEVGDVITVTPVNSSGKIQILSLERNYGNPIYTGYIEIRIVEDGLNIINVVPLEEYLYSVLASEMPEGSHEEVLKAMAICARGYAYTKMKDESFHAYNADLDDSTLCQRYNNAHNNYACTKAVKDTYGMVPVYDDKLIVPLYFSTSPGITCTNEEIWGGSSYAYFQANLETIDKGTIDLSVEADFIQFMKDSMGYDTIEKDLPYYRWSIFFTQEDISAAVNATLKERISMSVDNIKIKNDKGEYKATDITDIGDIRAVTVVERSKSGVVEALEIEGTLATIRVTGQTNIRNIITPVNQDIVKQDGSVVTGWTSLPSPFYYIVKENGGYTIYGGGFGHGVGLSQNGANILAEEGYNYKYILRHYYSYIDFSSIYIIESEKDEKDEE